MTTVYRASRSPDRFDPLDAQPSVARSGWRFNDRDTPILYAAVVQSLSVLEVVARPGWDTVKEVGIFPIEVPDGSIKTLDDLGIRLPTNWNNRPAAPTARRIGAQFLKAVDQAKAAGQTICGVLVPSVISTVDRNVMLDPRRTALYTVGRDARIPFNWLATTGT